MYIVHVMLVTKSKEIAFVRKRCCFLFFK